MGAVIHDVLLSDSSIHHTLFRIVCTTAQTLEVSYAPSLPILTSHDRLAFCSPY